MFKVKKKGFLFATWRTLLVYCGATTHIVNYGSKFVFIDDNFNPEANFIELADGIRSINVAIKVEQLLFPYVLKSRREVI